MGFTRPFRYTSASFTGGSVHLYREQRLSCCSRLLVLQSCGDPTPQETVSSQPRGATQLPPVSPVRLAAATVGADAPLLAAREALLLRLKGQGGGAARVWPGGRWGLLWYARPTLAFSSAKQSSKQFASMSSCVLTAGTIGTESPCRTSS